MLNLAGGRCLLTLFVNWAFSVIAAVASGLRPDASSPHEVASASMNHASGRGRLRRVRVRSLPPVLHLDLRHIQHYAATRSRSKSRTPRLDLRKRSMLGSLPMHSVWDYGDDNFERSHLPGNRAERPSSASANYLGRAGTGLPATLALLPKSRTPSPPARPCPDAKAIPITSPARNGVKTEPPASSCGAFTSLSVPPASSSTVQAKIATSFFAAGPDHSATGRVEPYQPTCRHQGEGCVMSPFSFAFGSAPPGRRRCANVGSDSEATPSTSSSRSAPIMMRGSCNPADTLKMIAKQEHVFYSPDAKMIAKHEHVSLSSPDAKMTMTPRELPAPAPGPPRHDKDVAFAGDGQAPPYFQLGGAIERRRSPPSSSAFFILSTFASQPEAPIGAPCLVAVPKDSHPPSTGDGGSVEQAAAAAEARDNVGRGHHAAPTTATSDMLQHDQQDDIDVDMISARLAAELTIRDEVLAVGGSKEDRGVSNKAKRGPCRRK
ncbi:unnamed protein product [Amoebophrya sp. A120]|nr:unnamed protein product [Amoebophrya sp. A120]|eukprot:GSA120T00021481001.1